MTMSFCNNDKDGEIDWMFRVGVGNDHLYL